VRRSGIAPAALFYCSWNTGTTVEMHVRENIDGNIETDLWLWYT